MSILVFNKSFQKRVREREGERESESDRLSEWEGYEEMGGT